MLIKTNIDSETAKVRLYVPHDLTVSENAATKKQHESEMLTPEQVQQRCEVSFREGFQQGERKGLQKGKESIQSRIESFTNLMQELNEQRNTLLTQSEDFVIEFTFGILKKILGDEAITTSKVDPERLRGIVKAALNEFTKSSRFVIRVHKKVADIFDEYEPRIREVLPGSIELKVVTDPSLNPADCLVKTDEGVLDARLQSQLSEIQRISKTAQTEDADSTEIQ